MTEEVLAWDASSNNRFLVSGKGSLIINPVSGLRAVEKQEAPLAAKVGLSTGAGRARPGRFGVHPLINVYVIWKFAAKTPRRAERFLTDLALDYTEAFRASEFYNLPSFPEGGSPCRRPGGPGRRRPTHLDKYAVLAGAKGSGRSTSATPGRPTRPSTKS